MHILLIMDAECKPKTTEMIDNSVSAEIPDRDPNPKLYELITTQNIHGPCGNVNPKSPCMDRNNVPKTSPNHFDRVQKSQKIPTVCICIEVQILEGKRISRKSMAMTLL